MEVLHALLLDRKSDIFFEDGWDRLTLTDDRGSLQSGQCGRDGKFYPLKERSYSGLKAVPGNLGLLVISCEKWRLKTIGSVTEG